MITNSDCLNIEIIGKDLIQKIKFKDGKYYTGSNKPIDSRDDIENLDFGDIYDEDNILYYRGQFRNIKYYGEITPYGYGIQYFDNFYYEGYFVNGLFHGYGEIIDLKTRKIIFSGEFKDNNKCY